MNSEKWDPSASSGPVQVTDSHPSVWQFQGTHPTTKEANAAVERVLQEQSQPTGGRTRKRKVYTSFSDEQRAVIEHCAAEHSNAAAVNKFTINFCVAHY